MITNERLAILGDQRSQTISAGVTNYMLASMGVLLIVACSMVANRLCIHWFVFPVAMCGILTGSDVVAWLRRELDTFDARAIVALLWFHGTFIAPLMHVAFQAHSSFYDAQVQDWPGAFGRMGLLTAVGLLCYKLSQRFFFRCSRPVRTTWTLDDSRFGVALVGALAISVVAAGIIFIQFGALRKGAGMDWTGGESGVHLSWLMMLGDPLPLLITIGLIRSLSSRRRDRSMVVVTMVLLALLISQFLLLGLRGSRSAVITAVFLAAALCHYRLRRIGIMWVLIGVFSLGVAGYYYAFFKRFGNVGLEAITSSEYRQTLAARSGITPQNILLGDLSRAEIQTFLLHRLTDEGSDYRLRWGQTYAFAVLTLIPRAIWANKPSNMYGKVAAGTDLQYGEGTFGSRRRASSRVYGVAGEAMLNFGVLGVPLGYFVYGGLLGWYRRKVATLHPEDARFFLVPILTMVAITAAFGDANNTMFFFLKNGVLLILLIFLSSVRVRRNARA